MKHFFFLLMKEVKDWLKEVKDYELTSVGCVQGERYGFAVL